MDRGKDCKDFFCGTFNIKDIKKISEGIDPKSEIKYGSDELACTLMGTLEMSQEKNTIDIFIKMKKIWHI